MIKHPREVLKTSGFVLGFQYLPRDLVNVNEWKIMFDSYINSFVKKSSSELFLLDHLFHDGP